MDYEVNSDTAFERALDSVRAAHPWPKRLNPLETLDYLKTVHGLDISEKTLRNRRCDGTGPRWEYFGNRPYTTPQWVDQWVEEAMSDRPANGRRRGGANTIEQPEAA